MAQNLVSVFRGSGQNIANRGATAQRVDELGMLTHKAMVAARHHCPRLMLSAVDRNIVNVRMQRGRDFGRISPRSG